MRPLGTVWTEMRHHEQRARELGEACRLGRVAALERYLTGVASEAPLPDRKAAAWSRAQVAIGEFVLAIGGA